MHPQTTLLLVQAFWSLDQAVSWMEWSWTCLAWKVATLQVSCTMQTDLRLDASLWHDLCPELIVHEMQQAGRSRLPHNLCLIQWQDLSWIALMHGSNSWTCFFHFTVTPKLSYMASNNTLRFDDVMLCDASFTWRPRVFGSSPGYSTACALLLTGCSSACAHNPS